MWLLIFALAALIFAPTGVNAQPPAAGAVTTVPPRPSHQLPLEPFRYQGNVGRTIADSDPPQFPQPVRPPKGAPNIVYILIDDAGYGQFLQRFSRVRSPSSDSLQPRRREQAG